VRWIGTRRKAHHDGDEHDEKASDPTVRTDSVRQGTQRVLARFHGPPIRRPR
jgi:hypothetical protein